MSECPVVFTRRRDERRVFMCVNVSTSAVQGTVAVCVCVYPSIKLSQLIRILAPELVYYPNLLRVTYLCDT